MGKEWVEIKNFDLYEANKDGEIRNKVTKKLLSQNSLDKDGNPTVKLFQNGKRKKICVHRIIGELFVPNPNHFPYIRRIDGNRLNNCASNLYWTENLK